MTYFISIDPGFKNLGFLIGQYQLSGETCTCTIDVAHSGVVSVGSSEDEVDALYQGVKLLVGAALEFTKGQPTVVLIEKQWLNPFNAQVGFQLHGLQAIIFSLFKEAGAKVLFISPSGYKNLLRIHPNPNESKRKASLTFAKKLLGDSSSWLKSDHLADCVNQLFYYLSTTFQRDIQFRLE
jgi:hypothetical protein